MFSFSRYLPRDGRYSRGTFAREHATASTQKSCKCGLQPSSWKCCVSAVSTPDFYLCVCVRAPLCVCVCVHAHFVEPLHFSQPRVSPVLVSFAQRWHETSHVSSAVALLGVAPVWRGELRWQVIWAHVCVPVADFKDSRVKCVCGGAWLVLGGGGFSWAIVRT